MDILLAGFYISAMVALWVYVMDTWSTRETKTTTPSPARKRLDKILDRIVTNQETPGLIERPSQREINLYNNPQEAEEQQIMSDIFNTLIPKEK